MKVVVQVQQCVCPLRLPVCANQAGTYLRSPCTSCCYLTRPQLLVHDVGIGDNVTSLLGSHKGNVQSILAVSHQVSACTTLTQIQRSNHESCGKCDSSVIASAIRERGPSTELSAV